MHFVRMLTWSLAAVAFLFLAGPSRATTFVFDQTSSNVPGYKVYSSIVVDGTLANLPTICNQGVYAGCGGSGSLPPYGFGALQAFTIVLGSSSSSPPAGVEPPFGYTLDAFTGACLSGGCAIGFPGWSISPDGIAFIDSLDQTDFRIEGFDPTSLIVFNSDALDGACPVDEDCMVSGHWDPVPEPASAPLFISGLLAFGVMATFARYSAHTKVSAGNRPKPLISG